MDGAGLVRPKGSVVARTGFIFFLSPLLAITALFAAGSPAMAVGSFANAAVADIALRYVGQWGGNACRDAGKAQTGQCKQFANCIIVLAGGGYAGDGSNDYAGSFIRAGGTEISEGQATKGDIIQWGSGTTRGKHTAIVVSNLGGSRFDVVDSNWGYPLNNETVRHHTIANIHADIFGTGAEPTRFIRMGTVQPGIDPDRDGDGTPDTTDRCPDQPGPANTQGCPDTDADGVADIDDRCPEAGELAEQGCAAEVGFPIDVNGDKQADLIHRWSQGVNTWLSNGNGTYTIKGQQAHAGYGYTNGVWLTGDVNGDKQADLIHRWSQGVNTWLSNGNGTYTIKGQQAHTGYGYTDGIWLSTNASLLPPLEPESSPLPVEGGGVAPPTTVAPAGRTRGVGVKRLLAKKVKRTGKTVLLKRAVVTNAGRKATAKVTWSTKKRARGTKSKYATVKTTTAGKVTLRTTGKAKKLYVKLLLKAPATTGYRAYSYAKKWTVK